MVGRHSVLIIKRCEKSTSVLKATAMGLVSGVDSPIRGTGTPRATLPPSSNTQCYSAHVLTKAGKWKYTTTFKPLSVGAGTNSTPLEHLHITQFEQNLVELGSSCGLDYNQF